MKEEKIILISPGNFQEIEGAHDIGSYKFIGPFYRSVYMRFGGKVTDGIYIVAYEEIFHLLKITNIGTFKAVSFGLAFLYIFKIIRISRIGERVDIDDSSGKIVLLKEVSNKVASDKTTATGYHQVFYFHLIPQHDRTLT
jgi:hypothetical protein